GSPTISIFLQPPGVIPVGGSVNICCSCQCDSGSFQLYRKGIKVRTLELRGGRAQFSISNATQHDSGSYICHYLDGDKVVLPNNSVEVRVEEFHLHKPVLSILPGQEVTAGAHVTFHCITKDASVTCFLYLEGQIKEAGFLTKNKDYKIFFHVHKGNEGRYSCQCFNKNGSIKWSAASETLDLVVR
ncbi:LIRA6 protein, partial [Geococcyx californianus]|nr:LIRA6 protein [Geococcyx californianus]